MINFYHDLNTSHVYRNEFFLTKEECEILVDYALKQKKEVATVGNNELKTDVRSNNVVWLNTKNNQTLHWLFERVGQIIQDVNNHAYKFDLYGLVEDFQFTAYENINDHYHWHIDSGSPQTTRKLSVTIQLSDPKDYEGCELQFAHEDNADKTAPLPENIKRGQGSITIFPSFLAHRVTELTSGKRYSLVIWCSGKPFK
jgi:PKHD-type hydroxylase